MVAERNGTRRSKVKRAYGEASTSILRERVWSKTPLFLRKMKAQDRVKDTKARGGSFTPVPETPTVGARADVRPRVTDGGGEGTRATTDEGAEDARHASGLARSGRRS